MRERVRPRVYFIFVYTKDKKTRLLDLSKSVRVSGRLSYRACYAPYLGVLPKVGMASRIPT
jgi:hypothetical protein